MSEMTNSNPGAPASPPMPPLSPPPAWTEVLMGHAQRCWDAETQNAERYASRGKLLITLCSTLLGLIGAGVAAALRGDALGYVARAGPSGLTMAFAIATFVSLLVSLGLLAFALFRLGERLWVAQVPDLDPKAWLADLRPGTPAHEGASVGSSDEAAADGPDVRRSDETADSSSRLLFLPDATLTRAAEQLDEITCVVFANTYVAAVNLHDRNRAEKRRLRKAEPWLWGGAVAAAVVAVFYVCLVLTSALFSTQESRFDGKPEPSTTHLDEQ